VLRTLADGSRDVGGLLVLEKPLMSSSRGQDHRPGAPEEAADHLPGPGIRRGRDLISRGPDRRQFCFLAADKVLKGAKPASVGRAATKFGPEINARTAKAFGLVLPPTLLASANDGWP
jgi:hypothetical protein